MRAYVPIFPGHTDLDFVDPSPGMQDQFGPPNGAKPKWPRHNLLLPLTPEPRGQLPGAGAPPVGSGDGHHKFGMSNPTYPGLTQCRLSTGIQQAKPTPDWFTFGLPTPVLRIPGSRETARVLIESGWDCFI